MTTLEEYMERSKKAINKEDTRAVYDMGAYNIDGYFEIKDLLSELQGYRKAYNRLLEEKRLLLERIKKNEEKDITIYKDNVALEIISTLIDTIELYIELSKVVE